jgi:hypothetical protein
MVLHRRRCAGIIAAVGQTCLGSVKFQSRSQYVMTQPRCKLAMPAGCASGVSLNVLIPFVCFLSRLVCKHAKLIITESFAQRALYFLTKLRYENSSFEGPGIRAGRLV